MKSISGEYREVFVRRIDTVRRPAIDATRIVERVALLFLVCVFWGLVLFAALTAFQ